MKLLFFTGALFLLITSCDSEKTEQSKEYYSFHDYLKKFKVIDLPFSLDQIALVEGLRQVDPEDSIYVEDGSAMYFGMLPDTSNYYGLITLLPGDEIFPVLTTFDKSGKRINAEPLMVFGCTGGPCVNYCSTYSIIKPDLSIFAVDTSIISECDSSDIEIPGKDSLFVTFLNGQILPDGKIELGAKQKKVETYPNN